MRKCYYVFSIIFQDMHGEHGETKLSNNKTNVQLLMLNLDEPSNHN